MVEIFTSAAETIKFISTASVLITFLGLFIAALMVFTQFDPWEEKQ